jgi:hypothetical protein
VNRIMESGTQRDEEDSREIDGIKREINRLKEE